MTRRKPSPLFQTWNNQAIFLPKSAISFHQWNNQGQFSASASKKAIFKGVLWLLGRQTCLSSSLFDTDFERFCRAEGLKNSSLSALR
jgi:hypothetical protein